MRMNVIHTACPVVAESTKVFVEHVSVGTERRRLEHSQRILWLAETEATIVYMHGGQELKRGSTFNDFYGFCTSFRDRAEEVAAICRRFSIQPDSSLELVVIATLQHVPVIETADNRRYNETRKPNYKRQFTIVPSEWRQEKPNPNFGVDGDTQEILFPPLSGRTIESVTVWSSKRTAEENARIAADLKERWQTHALGVEA